MAKRVLRILGHFQPRAFFIFSINSDYLNQFAAILPYLVANTQYFMKTLCNTMNCMAPCHILATNGIPRPKIKVSDA